MKTYKTYQECKIANPEGEVYEIEGRFETKEMIDQTNFGRDLFIKCNPSDHCMTVKEFLDADYRFEVGDFWLDYDGEVMKVKNEGVTNVNKPHEYDDKRYILRAAALEWLKRGDDADREALSRIGVQLSTIHLNKKPRTKVEYVKVTDSIFDLKDDFDGGLLYVKHEHARDYSKITSEQTLAQSLMKNFCYRRIETSMTEREAFIEEMSRYATPSILGKMFDAGCRFVN